MWWSFFAERGRNYTVCTTVEVLCIEDNIADIRQLFVFKVASVQPWTVISVRMLTTDTWMTCFYKPQSPHHFRAVYSLRSENKITSSSDLTFKEAWPVRESGDEFHQIHYTHVWNSQGEKNVIFLQDAWLLRVKYFSLGNLRLQRENSSVSKAVTTRAEWMFGCWKWLMPWRVQYEDELHDLYKKSPHIHRLSFSFCFIKTGSHCASQAGLKLKPPASTPQILGSPSVCHHTQQLGFLSVWVLFFSQNTGVNPGTDKSHLSSPGHWVKAKMTMSSGPAWAICGHPVQKCKTITIKGQVYSLGAEHLSSMCEILGSVPTPPKHN